MKNILLLTTLYPADDVKFLNNTAVCHYFAREWVLSGYNVRVFFLYNTFPFVLYPLLKLLNKRLANSSGIAVLDKYLPNEHSYMMDGVKITRIAVKKSRPGGTYEKSTIRNVSSRICEILQEEKYTPDVIVSHFLHPSVEIISNLKKIYDVPTSVSIHGKERKFSMQTAQNLASVDYMGYRSYSIGKCFEKIYGKKPNFYCFSGVPSNYIKDKPKSFINGISKFVFVGSLIRRKHPSCLVPAIAKVMGNDNFTLTYVGDGNQKKNILNLAKKNNCLDKLVFTGRVDRQSVVDELDKTDVFIMLSSDETFGLVYLEAMARGCIVIASTDEGMDGIIKHGVNGFLCKAGDVDSLYETLARIKLMDVEQLKALSESSIQTVRHMTDKKMADDYISFFKNWDDYGKR